MLATAIIAYKLICSDDLSLDSRIQDIYQQVNSCIAIGYEPYGSPIYGNGIICQAVIKRKKELT